MHMTMFLFPLPKMSMLFNHLTLRGCSKTLMPNLQLHGDHVAEGGAANCQRQPGSPGTRQGMFITLPAFPIAV